LRERGDFQSIPSEGAWVARHFSHMKRLPTPCPLYEKSKKSPLSPRGKGISYGGAFDRFTVRVGDGKISSTDNGDHAGGLKARPYGY